MTRTLVWDASALHHAALIDRLDVLGDLAAGPADCPWRSITTAAVLAEMQRNGLRVSTSWLDLVHVDEPDELRALLTWVQRLGAGRRDLGEATVCAWVEVHGGVTIIDDRDARQTAKRHKQDVHGSLWVIAEGVNDGRITMASGSALVNQLISAGARYPCPANGFEQWARRMRLVTPQREE